MNSFGFGGTNTHVILDDAFHYFQERGLTGNHCTAYTNAPDGLLYTGDIKPERIHFGTTNGTKLTNGANGMNGNRVNSTNGPNGTHDNQATTHLDQGNPRSVESKLKLLVWSASDEKARE